jgi:hypothetical protein
MLVITAFRLVLFAAVGDVTDWTVVTTSSFGFEHSFPQKWRTQSMLQPKVLGRYDLMLKFHLRMFNACSYFFGFGAVQGP